MPVTNTNSIGARLRERYYLGIILCITALTYLNTLRFGFVFDDFKQILTNPFIKSWRYVPQYFVSSVWKQLFPFDTGNYYRPLFFLWARLNYAAFANRALGWHATAIALHVVVTGLVFLVVHKMTGRSTPAILTTLIFGLHPIHHEVVAWVSGTTESLFAALFLAAFLAYLRAREKFTTPWMLLSGGLYALAILCKETAAVLPALVFVHAWIIDPAENPQGITGYGRRFVAAFKWTVYYIPVALAYLAVRYRVLSGFGHSASNVSFPVWLMTLPSVLLFYVKNWIVPVRLSEEYDLFYVLRPDLAHVIAPTLILIAIAFLIWKFRNALGAQNIGYAAAWIIVPLLPVLDFVVFRGGELVHDRYFYVPSIGASLLTALVIERVATTGRVVFGQPLHRIAAVIALAGLLAICTTWETSFWKDDYTLFARAHQIAPRSPTAINDLGVDSLERQEIDQAQKLFETGLQQNSGDAVFPLNLGRVQYIKKNYAKAEEYTKEAIQLNPNGAESYIVLGRIQLRENRLAESALNFRRGVELSPYDPGFHTSYGLVLALNHDCNGAITQFQAALALSPGDVVSQTEMARCRVSQSPEATASGNTSQSGSSSLQWGSGVAQLTPEIAGK